MLEKKIRRYQGNRITEEAEETRRKKARSLRYKKPIVKEISLDFIQQELWGHCGRM